LKPSEEEREEGMQTLVLITLISKGSGKNRSEEVQVYQGGEGGFIREEKEGVGRGEKGRLLVRSLWRRRGGGGGSFP